MKLLAKDGGNYEMLIYGPIGDWFDETQTRAQEVVTALAELNGEPLLVRINSGGGDVFEGFTIYEALLSYGGPVDVKVDGVAASAASTIAMAGRTLMMAESSLLMIHDSWGFVMGNSEEMRKQSELLDKIDGVIAAGYARKSGLAEDKLRSMMDAETWLTADEAVSLKLADSKASSKATNYANVAMFGYKNTPKPLLRAGSCKPQPPKCGEAKPSGCLTKKEADARLKMLAIAEHEKRA